MFSVSIKSAFQKFTYNGLKNTVNTCVNWLCICIVLAVFFILFQPNSRFNLLTMHMWKLTVCLLHGNHLNLPV